MMSGSVDDSEGVFLSRHSEYSYCKFTRIVVQGKRHSYAAQDVPHVRSSVQDVL